MNVERLLDFARGRMKVLSLKERVRRDFAEFLAWVKERTGIPDDPCYFFEKATWDFIIFQPYWTEFQAPARQRAEAQQRIDQAFEFLKEPGNQRATITAALMTWPEDSGEPWPPCCCLRRN